MEFEKIKEITAQVLNIKAEDIEIESAFSRDLGADSLELFQIMCQLEDGFDITLTYDEMSRIDTVKDMIDYIHSQSF